MEKLDEIVAGLTAGGEVVAAGGFTLDRAHALRKLEQYQMRDPALAVARFVEAAALLGGSLRAFASPWGLQLRRLDRIDSVESVPADQGLGNSRPSNG